MAPAITIDPKTWHKVAAISGAAALGLGTYGFHIFNPKNSSFKEVWNIASLYHLAHTAALIGAPITKRPNIFGGLLTAGILAFSGSIHQMFILGYVKGVTQIGKHHDLQGLTTEGHMPNQEQLVEHHLAFVHLLRTIVSPDQHHPLHQKFGIILEDIEDLLDELSATSKYMSKILKKSQISSTSPFKLSRLQTLQRHFSPKLVSIVNYLILVIVAEETSLLRVTM
ncbi:hypothetical protein Cni_G24255 [Canna indica]|uniref:Transmembrane protein 256 homolog n=1 Tax=Canna indica TaxID=4628 RepID=A0AAQ3KVD1_9LILI|nr:hypothetical protein Cni_G24255 [Canna indica]